jgi:hypothetical protein
MRPTKMVNSRSEVCIFHCFETSGVATEGDGAVPPHVIKTGPVDSMLPSPVSTRSSCKHSSATCPQKLSCFGNHLFTFRLMLKPRGSLLQEIVWTGRRQLRRLLQTSSVIVFRNGMLDMSRQQKIPLPRWRLDEQMNSYCNKSSQEKPRVIACSCRLPVLSRRVRIAIPDSYTIVIDASAIMRF